jgi:exosortase E/protease (VPEID-CTERM system)
VIGLALIAAIVVPELIFLSHQPPKLVLPLPGPWWLWLLVHCAAMTTMLPIFAAAVILFSWRSFRVLVIDELGSEVADGSIRAISVILHLLAMLGLIAWTEGILLTGRLQAPGGIAWFFPAAGLLALALLSWMRALFPAAFWLRWLRLNPAAFVSALAVAAFARIAGTHAQLMWRPMSASTLSAVAVALRMLGRTPIVGPHLDQIGIPGFSIEVTRTCSGLEGIGLIAVFVAGYLWFCRRDLRFPTSLILLPAGMVAMWFMNVFRITALMLIGVWSPAIAMDGFHTVAGWLLYTVTASAIVVVSQRSNLFSRFALEAGELTAANPAAVYLAPLLTILLIAMLTRIAGGGFEYLYALKVIGAAAVLWWYRDRLAEFPRDWSWPAVAIGGLVFVEWIVLQRNAGDAASQDLAFATSLRQMPTMVAAGWLVVRVIGAVATVPVAEELAFRGYLLRKLISADFEKVDFAQFTLLSFVVSSTLFGLMHHQWLAGVIAGMLFAAAMHRRGRLFDAVVAHATANAMLSAYVLATGQWRLWN